MKILPVIRMTWAVCCCQNKALAYQRSVAEKLNFLSVSFPSNRFGSLSNYYHVFNYLHNFTRHVWKISRLHSSFKFRGITGVCHTFTVRRRFHAIIFRKNLVLVTFWNGLLLLHFTVSLESQPCLTYLADSSVDSWNYIWERGVDDNKD